MAVEPLVAGMVLEPAVGVDLPPVGVLVLVLVVGMVVQQLLLAGVRADRANRKRKLINLHLQSPLREDQRVCIRTRGIMGPDLRSVLPSGKVEAEVEEEVGGRGWVLILDIEARGGERREERGEQRRISMYVCM